MNARDTKLIGSCTWPRQDCRYSTVGSPFECRARAVTSKISLRSYVDTLLTDALKFCLLKRALLSEQNTFPVVPSPSAPRVINSAESQFSLSGLVRDTTGDRAYPYEFRKDVNAQPAMQAEKTLLQRTSCKSIMFDPGACAVSITSQSSKYDMPHSLT